MSMKERYLALEDTLLDMIASHVKIDENAQEAEADPEKWKIKKISEAENLKKESESSLQLYPKNLKRKWKLQLIGKLRGQRNNFNKRLKAV